jgi:hypothetical protein
MAVLALLAGLSGGAILHGQDSDRYERFKTGGYLNGLGWITMTSEEKSTFLLGFDEGVEVGLDQVVFHKWMKSEQETKMMADLLVREHPGVDVVAQIDHIYKEDTNLRLPIIAVYQAAKLRIDGASEGVVWVFLSNLHKRF